MFSLHENHHIEVLVVVQTKVRQTLHRLIVALQRSKNDIN